MQTTISETVKLQARSGESPNKDGGNDMTSTNPPSQSETTASPTVKQYMGSQPSTHKTTASQETSTIDQRKDDIHIEFRNDMSFRDIAAKIKDMDISNVNSIRYLLPSITTTTVRYDKLTLTLRGEVPMLLIGAIAAKSSQEMILEGCCSIIQGNKTSTGEVSH